MNRQFDRAYELLADYEYYWVHIVPSYCYLEIRSTGTLPVGLGPTTGHILIDPGHHILGSRYGPNITILYLVDNSTFGLRQICQVTERTVLVNRLQDP